GRELNAPSSRTREGKEGISSDSARFLRRGGPSNPLRRRHHHRGLSSDPDPRRSGGEDVPADGADGRVRAGWLAGPDLSPHAGADLPFPSGKSGGEGSVADASCQADLPT